jgi:hypothetical protein
MPRMLCEDNITTYATLYIRLWRRCVWPDLRRRGAAGCGLESPNQRKRFFRILAAFDCRIFPLILLVILRFFPSNIWCRGLAPIGHFLRQKSKTVSDAVSDLAGVFSYGEWFPRPELNRNLPVRRR